MFGFADGWVGVVSGSGVVVVLGPESLRVHPVETSGGVLESLVRGRIIDHWVLECVVKRGTAEQQ